MSQYHDPFHRPPWSEEDSEALRAFLQTQTGKRLVFRLQNDRPSHPATKEHRYSLEANALWASEVRGFERAVSFLFEYLVAPIAEGARASVYPSIDDDAQWAPALQAAPPLKAPEPVKKEPEIDLANPPVPTQ